VQVGVRVNHGGTAVGGREGARGPRFTVALSRGDTVAEAKRIIAACPEACGVPAEKIMLSFGPQAKPLGAKYEGDPRGREDERKVGDYSVLDWVERFPHWGLTVKFLPAKPPPPGEAAVRAAAIAEERDPEEMLQESREKGDVAKLEDLPPPWGDAPQTGFIADEFKKDMAMPGEGDFFPPRYGPDSHPKTDSVRRDEAGWTPAPTLPAATPAEVVEEVDDDQEVD